jgi:hypothetical protein
LESFIPLISEVGFPIVVTLYFLYRIEAKLDVAVHTIESLPEPIKDHKERRRVSHQWEFFHPLLMAYSFIKAVYVKFVVKIQKPILT